MDRVTLEHVDIVLAGKMLNPPAPANAAAQAVSGLSSKEVSAAASFRLLEPSRLPSGYSFLSGAHRAGAIEIAQLTYFSRDEGAWLHVRMTPLVSYRATSPGGRPTITVFGDVIDRADVGASPAALWRSFGFRGGTVDTSAYVVNVTIERQDLLVTVSGFRSGEPNAFALAAALSGV